MWNPTTIRPFVGEVCRQSPQHLRLGTGRQEDHDVACAHDHVEGIGDVARREIKFGEVPDEPLRTRMVFLRSGDQFGIDVDSDDAVPDLVEVAAEAPRPAPGVEDSRAPRGTIASISRASPTRSAPSAAIVRKRSMYHSLWPGAVSVIQRGEGVDMNPP